MKRGSSPPFYTWENSSTKKSQNSPEATELWSKRARIPRVCLIPEFVGFIMSCLPCWREGGDPLRKRPAFASLQVTTLSGAAWAWGHTSAAAGGASPPSPAFPLVNVRTHSSPWLGGVRVRICRPVFGELVTVLDPLSCTGARHWHLGKVSTRLPGACLPDSLPNRNPSLATFPWKRFPNCSFKNSSFGEL